MIFFESYHFIVPLKLLESKYPGGLEYFKKDVPNSTYKDDGQIATVRFLLREKSTSLLIWSLKKDYTSNVRISIQMILQYLLL